MKYLANATAWLQMGTAMLLVILAMIITGCDEVSPIIVDAASPDKVSIPPEWGKWYGGIEGKWYGDVDDWAVTKPIGDLLQPSVRLIYFLPSDREARPERAEALCRMIAGVQEFYADEMERNGFGRKTFTVETDTGGIPVVHFIQGKSNDDYYYQGHSHIKIFEECYGYINDFRHIYFIIVDSKHDLLSEGRWCGLANVTHVPTGSETDRFRGRGGNETGGETVLGGRAIIPASGFCFFDDVYDHFHPLRVTTHELAHAFGLYHDLQADNHQWGPNSKSAVGGTGHHFSHCDTEWLSVSRFFNEGPFPEDTPGSIELLAAPKHTPNGISISFRAEDADGLHQAQLLTPEQYRFFGCKQLNGTTSTVEFVSPALAKEQVDRVTLQIIDKMGGITWATILVDW